MKHVLAAAMLVAAILAPFPAAATWLADAETGVAVAGYNDVAIPGDTGTRFSLTDDLSADPAWYVRLRLGKTFAQRHAVTLLAAPLTIFSEGRLDRDVVYDDKVFAEGETVRARYRFDSYRLTYRYDFLLEPLELGVGVSGKIRDAAIALDGAEFAEYTNTGFVPLVNFRVYWNFASLAGLLVEGDALAGPQGRAEDVLAALTLDVAPAVRLRAGYRILEGGADNDKVYTFALVHYGGVGLSVGF